MARFGSRWFDWNVPASTHGRFEGFPPEYYSILAGLHQKALADAEVLERKEEKIKLLEDTPEEKIEEVE